MRIRSLQNKIFVLVVSLFIAVFVLNFYSIIKAAGKQAESLIEARLNVGKRIVLDEFRTEQASFDSNVATIAQDWGFRQALGQGVDSRTLVNILQNHINRISGDFAFIFDPQNNLIASTYDLPQHSLARLHQAAVDPEHNGNMPLVIIDNTPFFLSSEIVEAPIEIGRIVVGKALNSSLFTRLEEQISLGITLINTNQSINSASQNKNTGVFSTMPALIEQTQDNILNPFLSVSFINVSGEGYTQKLDWYGVEYITVSLPLNIVNLNSSQNSFVVVLHDSLSQAMSIFDRFWIDILPFFFGGILVSLLGALAIARGITRPVKSLLEAAKYVANGNYSAKLEVKQSGELGQLAQEFQNMQSAVMARENEIKQQALALQESEKIKFEAKIAHKERLLAEEATQAKSQFLASMSHEIRTPLTSIIGFSETLQDKSMNSEDQAQAINTINRCGTHLLNVINDILDVSKIEAGKIEVEVMPTPIFPLLHEVKQLANMQANNKGIDFELNLNFPLPLIINSDPTRLKQILFNLINNAIKFTESGKVSLTVQHDTQTLQHDAQTLLFTLQDTGIGMTEQQLGKLFSAFTQADSSITRQHGGTGLGLYICKQLSSLLGGHIEVKSQYKLGSEFKLSLPCPQDAEAKQVANLSEAKRLSQLSEQAQHIPSLKGKVLYADDNDDNRRLVSYLIKQTGAQVITAENGEQAVEQALANDFELVLMDMQMPVMDGIEATELLCSAGFSKPIIMMTANVDKDSIEQCAQSGAVGHFGKPVDTVKFHHLLSEYLTQSDVTNHEPSLADLDNFDDMAMQFLSSLPEKVENLKTAYKAQDWLTIQDIVHQIKGSAGSFGYQKLSEHAAAFEKTLQETKQEQNHEPFDLFLQQIQYVIEGVE